MNTLTTVFTGCLISAALFTSFTPPAQAATATPPAATATPAAKTQSPIGSVNALRAALVEIGSASGKAAQARADALWQTLSAGKLPLVIGDHVFFFYKGPAKRVDVRGDFTGWEDGAAVPARAIGNTDLWMAESMLPLDARANYKFVLNGAEWVLDPANPRIQKGGLAPTSILDMPNYTATLATDPRVGIPAGTLSGDLLINSKNLGYPVAYRVYTPAGYREMGRLPVLYITDGNDWLSVDFGRMNYALDNLIADKRMAPVIAVFIDAREPGKPKINRRESEFIDRHEAFGAFIADELAPAIDRAYRTIATPEGRTIQGVSFGGLFATWFAARYSDLFHKAAIFSPSYWALLYPQSFKSPEREAALKQMGQTMNAAGDPEMCSAGTVPCLPKSMKVFLTAGIPDWDVGNVMDALRPAEQQGIEVRFVPTREGHTWSNWRSTLDEMLAFHFGA